ncbi:hypothetical protein CDD83_6192 [Cordyceps sp. RAO-2017]|nr:hypothetical protein CDD83_6192 [Cordyceps sp. RAO-2017]
MADRIHRVTMFKIPSAGDRDKLLEQYQILQQNSKRDGRPYILSLVVGAAEADARAQGFTLVSKSEFASMDDMRYYDEQCPAHAALKAFAGAELAVDGVLTVYFRPHLVVGS